MASSAHSTRRVLLAWLPALLYMALIWALSSAPVTVPLDILPFKDKGAHFIEYGTLGVLNAFAVQRSWPGLGLVRCALWAALLTFLWGYLDEVHQAFVPGRNSDAIDLLVDTLGGSAGACGYALWVGWRARRSS